MTTIAGQVVQAIVIYVIIYWHLNCMSLDHGGKLKAQEEIYTTAMGHANSARA